MYYKIQSLSLSLGKDFVSRHKMFTVVMQALEHSEVYDCVCWVRTDPGLSSVLSPNVAKRGILKELRLKRACHGTFPESSPSLQPSGGTSQGRNTVWLFTKPCRFPVMNLLVSS